MSGTNGTARLKRCEETRTRYTKDIPDIKSEVTEHTIHRDWCPYCRKIVEPPVTDALLGATPSGRFGRPSSFAKTDMAIAVVAVPTVKPSS